MPSWCCVPYCSSGSSGYKFPRDEFMKKKWLKAIRRETFCPSQSSIVCKNHFTSEDLRFSLPSYVEYPSSTKFYLKKTAVPNVFSWNSDQQIIGVQNDVEIEENNKCRICLHIGDIPIFGNDDMPNISDDVETFGSIEIRKEDNFPKYICKSCEKLLQAAVLFRKTAKESDLYLKSHTEQQKKSNNPLDCVKIESSTGFVNTNVDIEKDALNIKKEIIVEPSYFLEQDIYIDDIEHPTKVEEVEDNLHPNLLIVENSAVSLVKQKAYNCITCHIDFPTAKQYTQHKKSATHKKTKHNKKIECEICFKNISKINFSRHMESHSNDNKDDKLQCPICNKSYSKTYFNYHLTHAHNQDTKTEPERIECTICHKDYEKQYYKFHLAIHNDSSKYVCEQCGKSFIQQSAFKRHCLIHGNELAYKCTECPYRGRHPGLVKTHMQTHTRDYQHRCMECPARFLTKSNLNKHLKRHKGPVDFKCESCKRGFYTKLELDRHYEADHMGVKNHICNVCGKAFGYRNAMMSHQLKVHKRDKLTDGKGRLPMYLEVEKTSKNNDI